MSQVQPGTTVVLKATRESSADFIRYLNKKDIRLGIEIKVLELEPFDSSLTVSYEKHDAEVLSDTVCSKLLVE